MFLSPKAENKGSFPLISIRTKPPHSMIQASFTHATNSVIHIHVIVFPRYVNNNTRVNNKVNCQSGHSYQPMATVSNGPILAYKSAWLMYLSITRKHLAHLLNSLQLEIMYLYNWSEINFDKIINICKTIEPILTGDTLKPNALNTALSTHCVNLYSNNPTTDSTLISLSGNLSWCQQY